MKLFTRKRTITFVNPIRIYSWHRQQIVEDFPVSLPPDEDENIFTTTMLLATIRDYKTKPMATEKRKTK